MKSLIVYDSNYGNSETVARTIATSIPGSKAVRITDLHSNQLADLDLLIVGSPTNGGRPTEELQNFLQELDTQTLHGIKVAAFDTRFAANEHGFGLKMLMRTIGFAAEKISHILQEKGGVEIAKPTGFIVDDKEGPLHPGELERAKNWAKQISAGVHVVA